MTVLSISIDDLKNLLLNRPVGVKIVLTIDRGGVLATMDETKEQVIQRKFKNLIGQPITITEASAKYNIPRGSIQEWKEKGYLSVVNETYPATIDEADVAYCAEIYKERKSSGFGFRGVPLLDERGLPYQIKNKKLSEYRRRKK